MAAGSVGSKPSTAGADASAHAGQVTRPSAVVTKACGAPQAVPSDASPSEMGALVAAVGTRLFQLGFDLASVGTASAIPTDDHESERFTPL